MLSHALVESIIVISMQNTQVNLQLAANHALTNHHSHIPHDVRCTKRIRYCMRISPLTSLTAIH